MKKLIVAAFAVLLSLPAVAAEKKGEEKKAEEKKADEKKAAPAQPGQPPAMDITKMGSAARKPKDEKAVKKEIDAFLKEELELEKKADFNAMLPRLDFPIYMVTDDSKGVVMAKMYTQEEYVAEMKPWFEQMPKDLKMTHKHTVRVLSDALATVEDEHTTTMGKQKASGRSESLLIKKDGKWKWKAMFEAGWGDMANAPPPAQPAQPAK